MMWKSINLSLRVLVFAGLPVFLPVLAHADEPAGGAPGAASGVTSDNEKAPAGAPTSKTDLIDPFAEPGAPAEPSAPVEPSAPQDIPAQAAQAPEPAHAGTAQATLSFRNDAGNAFALSEARFVMDGKDLPTVIANPERGKSYVIYSGPVAAGRHIVSVRMVYQGRSRGGAFSYMKGYKLNVASDEVITTPEDRAVGFTIVSKEQKGISLPLDKRIAVGVEENRRR